VHPVYLGTPQYAQYPQNVQNLQNQPQEIDEGCAGTVKNHKWIFIGVGIGIILAIVAIVLGVYYGTKITEPPKDS
jgi:hypothetical protein